MNELNLSQELSTETFPYIKDDVIFRRMELPTGRKSELLKLSDLSSAEINASAEEILVRCTGQRSVENICQEISAKFKTNQNETLVKITKILKTLYKNGFIDIKSNPVKAKKINDVVKLKYFLNSVFFECTLNCNLKCVHCYAYDPQNSSKDMDLKTIYGLIDQFADMGGISIIVSGGEPLMRDDVCDIIAYAAEKPLNVRLLTNGVLITRDIAKRLKKSGLDSVQISLDGSDAISHDKYRGVKGAFEKTVSGITFLHEEGLSVDVGAVLNKLNIEKSLELIDFCQQWGITPSFGMQQPKGRASYEGKPYELSFYEYSDAIISINRYLGEKYGIDKFTMLNNNNRKNENRCGAGTSGLAIASDGGVWPCREYINSAHLLGNVCNDRLIDIWDSEQPILEKLRNQKVANINLCADCKHVNYCGSGCQLDAFRQWGDCDWPDIQRCLLMKLMDKHVIVKEQKNSILNNMGCNS